jgi:predicted glycoside hydrolase/deacetylase ChbG (UPF0249 family)
MIDYSAAKVILTSDDFGLSKLYNEKIIEMLQIGYLTSVSVMIKKISEKQISQVNTLIDTAKNKDISIGLHLELSELDYLNEVNIQWSLFETIFGSSPDYLDLHKSNCFKGDYNELAKFCNLKNIAFRKYLATNIPVDSPTFSITATNESIIKIKEIIGSFECNKIYELVFHIGVNDPESISKLNKERELDIEKLIEISQFIKEKRMILANYKSL